MGFQRVTQVDQSILDQLLVSADAASLPVAELVHIGSDDSSGAKDNFGIESNGKQFGTLSLRTRENRQSAWISRIDIDYPAYMNEGYGSYAHLAAASIALSGGNVFRNDPIGLSGDAMRVWQRFIDVGVATVVAEPWDNGSDYGWMGHFEMGNV